MATRKFWHDLIKKYYFMDLYTDKDLNVFVPRYITEEEKEAMIAEKHSK